MQTTERVEYRLTYQGAPMMGQTFLNAESARDYVLGGVAVGNDREDYEIEVRQVVEVTTEWAAATGVPGLNDVGDPTFWIVDEDGATFAFEAEIDARVHADNEKDGGAVNLVLFPATVPAAVAERGEEAVADWAASNAEPDERAEYLTGNAEDIAEQDAEDDAAPPWVITGSDGDILDRFASEEARDDALHTGGYPDDAEPAFVNDWAAVLTPIEPDPVSAGPRTFTTTMTQEAADFLAAAQAMREAEPHYIEASVLVDGYTDLTEPEQAARALIGWIRHAVDPIHVSVKGDDGSEHQVEVPVADFDRGADDAVGPHVSSDTAALDKIERERPCLDADTTDADLAEWVRNTILPVLESTGRL